jgi:hypothetical protein
MDSLVSTYYKINAKGNSKKNKLNDDEIKLKNHLFKNKGFFVKKCWKRALLRIE